MRLLLVRLTVLELACTATYILVMCSEAIVSIMDINGDNDKAVARRACQSPKLSKSFRIASPISNRWRLQVSRDMFCDAVIWQLTVAMYVTCGLSSWHPVWRTLESM